MPVAYDIQGGK